MEWSGWSGRMCGCKSRLGWRKRGGGDEGVVVKEEEMEVDNKSRQDGDEMKLLSLKVTKRTGIS